MLSIHLHSYFHIVFLTIPLARRIRLSACLFFIAGSFVVYISLQLYSVTVACMIIASVSLSGGKYQQSGCYSET